MVSSKQEKHIHEVDRKAARLKNPFAPIEDDANETIVDESNVKVVAEPTEDESNAKVVDETNKSNETNGITNGQTNGTHNGENGSNEEKKWNTNNFLDFHIFGLKIYFSVTNYNNVFLISRRRKNCNRNLNNRVDLNTMKLHGTATQIKRLLGIYRWKLCNTKKRYFNKKLNPPNLRLSSINPNFCLLCAMKFLSSHLSMRMTFQFLRTNVLNRNSSCMICMIQVIHKSIIALGMPSRDNRCAFLSRSLSNVTSSHFASKQICCFQIIV